MQQLIPYSRGKLSALVWYILRKINKVRRYLVKRVAAVLISQKVQSPSDFHHALKWLSKREFSNFALVEGLVTTFQDATGPAIMLQEACSAINSDEIYEPLRQKLIRATLRALPEKPASTRVNFLDSVVGFLGPDELTLKVACEAFNKSGNFDRTVKILDALPDPKEHLLQNEWFKAAITRQTVLENGVPLSTKEQPSPQPAYTRVMYCVSQSRPHLTSGYAIRTHEILSELRARGLEVEAFARDGFPNDRWDFAGAPLSKATFSIDEVTYHFCPNRQFGISNRELLKYYEQATARYTRQIDAFKPSIVHAASNFSCGLAAANAAAKAGLPFVYEMRGLWHLSRASSDPSFADSAEFKLQDRLEIDCAKKADKVLAITQSLADYIIERGVDAEKVKLLPNAVDTNSFKPLERNPKLEDQLQLKNTVVIGYVGSLVNYEGLDLLLEAIAKVRLTSVTNFKMLVIGDGRESNNLRRQAKRLKILDLVVFVGRVAHEEVTSYYSLIDIVPLPRRGEKVCEIVSPLKPFEAMAMGKTLLVSDVAALAEIVKHGETGFIHKKDDVEDITDKLAFLLSNPKSREEMGVQAREWVMANRTWERVCEQDLIK